MRLQIGLTGGIGSGKSTVAQLFTQLGLLVIDADKLAREVVLPGTIGLKKLVSQFGDSILNADGTLARQKLGKLVFDNPTQLQALNKITHPLIQARRVEIVANSSPNAIILHDVPLLIESNLYYQLPLVITVTTELSKRIERLQHARGMTAEDVKNRMAAQLSDSERIAKSNIVVNNNSSLDELATVVKQIWENRIRYFHQNLQITEVNEVDNQLIKHPMDTQDSRYLAELSLIITKLAHELAKYQPQIKGTDMTLTQIEPKEYSNLALTLQNLGFIPVAHKVAAGLASNYLYADPNFNVKLTNLL